MAVAFGHGCPTGSASTPLPQSARHRRHIPWARCRRPKHQPQVWALMLANPSEPPFQHKALQFSSSPCCRAGWSHTLCTLKPLLWCWLDPANSSRGANPPRLEPITAFYLQQQHPSPPHPPLYGKASPIRFWEGLSLGDTGDTLPDGSPAPSPCPAASRADKTPPKGSEQAGLRLAGIPAGLRGDFSKTRTSPRIRAQASKGADERGSRGLESPRLKREGCTL